MSYVSSSTRKGRNSRNAAITPQSSLAYLSKSLPIFNKINLICKTAGQEPQQQYKLLQWPPVVQYQQICNKIFVWPSLSVDRELRGARGSRGWPTVGRRVVAAWLLQIIYLHLSPPSSGTGPPPPTPLYSLFPGLHFHLLIKSLAIGRVRNAGQI